MTGTRWHLPAVDMRMQYSHLTVEQMRSVTEQLSSGSISVVAPANVTQTMVTACGKRGPIRSRDTIGVLPVQVSMPIYDEAPLVCGECQVLWDKAEEDGALLTRWVSDFSREWRGPGAVLFRERPTRQPCRQCRGDTGRDYVPITVIPRRRRQKE